MVSKLVGNQPGGGGNRAAAGSEVARPARVKLSLEVLPLEQLKYGGMGRTGPLPEI